MDTNQFSQIMTLREAAVFLRLSTSSLYKRTDIPRHKLPNSILYRYDRDEVLAWIRSGPASIRERLEPKSEPSPAVPTNDTGRKAVRRRFNSRYQQ